MEPSDKAELATIASEMVDMVEGQFFDECLDQLFDLEAIKETNNDGMHRATTLMLYIATGLQERAKWRLKNLD